MILVASNILHHNMLVDKFVEHRDLLLDPQPKLIGFEENRILRFEFLPHEVCESRLDIALAMQGRNYFLLIHIALYTPLDKVLDHLNIRHRQFTCIPLPQRYLLLL